MQTKFENVNVGEYYPFKGKVVDVRDRDGGEYAVYFPYTVGSQLNPRPDVCWISEKNVKIKNGDIIEVDCLVVKKVESFDTETAVISREIFVIIDPMWRHTNLTILADEYEKYLDEC